MWAQVTSFSCFLHFILRIHFSLRLPDTLEKGINYCLLGLRFTAWLVTFPFFSHSPPTQSWPVVVVASHWREAGLDMVPTNWRGERRGPQQRTMRKTTPIQRKKSLFLPFRCFCPKHHHPILQQTSRVKAMLSATLTHTRQSFNSFEPFSRLSFSLHEVKM